MRIGLITDEQPREAFEAFLRRHHPGISLEGAARPLEFKPIYQGMARTTVADRALSVGEAAGQVREVSGLVYKTQALRILRTEAQER